MARTRHLFTGEQRNHISDAATIRLAVRAGKRTPDGVPAGFAPAEPCWDVILSLGGSFGRVLASCPTEDEARRVARAIGGFAQELITAEA